MFENIYIIEKLATIQHNELQYKLERQHQINNAGFYAGKTSTFNLFIKSGKNFLQSIEEKKMLSIIIIILILLSLVFFAGKSHMYIIVERERELLRSLSTDLSGRIYREDQIEGLPVPVQRYFRNVLTDGQPYISSVYLKHDGQFKTALDKEWINIEGEQHFTTDEPGFLWNGKTALFTVQDMYIAGKGHIRVSLLNIIKVLDGKGPEYDQGELLRWLGESVWFPTNLLPSSRLQWTAIDDNMAKLSFSYNDQILSYKVSFNGKGEIVQLETSRYMSRENQEIWIGRLSKYEEINGMKIPMEIEALWKLTDGEHSYARFNVNRIHHN
ncbi:MAG: hypothetical protein PQJ58_19945 [Spirochaetales bacterium]|nr:hypothetical protein [Spirochaetales bacterium]